MRWNPDEWFGPQREMTMGVELELMIYDGNRDELLRDFNRARPVYDRVPQNIWKDYYPHQLEIRTDPFDNPGEVIQQAVDFYKLADEEFQKENLYIIPVPWTGLPNEPVYCGMHVHIRYKDNEHNRQFYNNGWGAYPFVLAIADHTKNSEIGELNTSTRIKNSRHIKMPAVRQNDFMAGVGQARYADVTVNNLSSATDANPRNRLKEISTLETRIFDTPTLYSHLKFICEGMFNVFSHVKSDNPVVKDLRGAYEHLLMTRSLVTEQRYGQNKILRESNSNVCRDISELFGMEFPEQTQFEFREQFQDWNIVERKLLMRKFAWPNTEY